MPCCSCCRWDEVVVPWLQELAKKHDFLISRTGSLLTFATLWSASMVVESRRLLTGPGLIDGLKQVRGTRGFARGLRHSQFHGRQILGEMQRVPPVHGFISQCKLLRLLLIAYEREELDWGQA